MSLTSISFVLQEVPVLLVLQELPVLVPALQAICIPNDGVAPNVFIQAMRQFFGNFQHDPFVPPEVRT